MPPLPPCFRRLWAEHVFEDVKTLLRIIIVLLTGCTVTVYSVSDEGDFMRSKLNGIFKNHPTVAECSSEFIFTGFYFTSGTVLIPLYELLLILFFVVLVHVLNTCLVMMC